MNQDTVLVVVDMQPKFNASNNLRTLAYVEREIKRAKKADQFIIILEFEPWYEDQLGEYGQQTHWPLMIHLKGFYDNNWAISPYPNYCVKTKSTDDGSREIKAALEEKQLCPSKIIVCGVNTEACVKRTVVGLLQKCAAKIVIPKKACNQPDNGHWDPPFSGFMELPQVAIV